MHQALDIRSLDASASVTELLLHVDVLPVDGVLDVHGEHDPMGLVHVLQLERANVFDWRLQQLTPDDFILEIRRRRHQAHVDMISMLEDEHRRLDQLVAQLEARANVGMLGMGRCTFDELRIDLERHLDFEEQVVFPAYVAVVPAATGRVQALASEKAVVRRILRDVGVGLTAGDRVAVLSGLSDLHEVLGPHFVAEERTIFPALSRSLGAPRESSHAA